MDGDIFEQDLNQTGMNDLNITSVVVLVYVLSFIYDNIPNITKTILQMFGVTADGNPVGEKLGEDLMKATKGYIDKGKTVVKTFIKYRKS